MVVSAFIAAECSTSSGGNMSLWITRKGPGKRKNIFTISIIWEIVPVMILLLVAAVIYFLKN
jgi:hypothetical protein